MSDKNNGNECALPILETETGINFHDGLTKREHFAVLAMQGLLANSGGVIQANNMSGTGWCNSDSNSMASLSVECADALLAELEKPTLK